MQKYYHATFRELSYPAIDRIYRRINNFKDELGSQLDRRSRAEAMIGACIVEGVDTRFEIVKMLGSAGLSKNFVRRIIEERTGPFPDMHLWQPDQFGRLRLLPNL